MLRSGQRGEYRMLRDGNAPGSIGDSTNAGDSTGDLEQSIFICDGPRITRVQPLFQLSKNPDPIIFFEGLFDPAKSRASYNGPIGR